MNRDSPAAQIQLGKCWALLSAGCEFNVYRIEQNTIYLEIFHLSFNSFEYGASPENNESDTFYLPTLERLKQKKGRDWY